MKRGGVGSSQQVVPQWVYLLNFVVILLFLSGCVEVDSRGFSPDCAYDTEFVDHSLSDSMLCNN